MLHMMELHTAMFVALTGVGKTHLDSLEREYLNYFNFIIILCPTLSSGGLRPGSNTCVSENINFYLNCRSYY